MAKLEDYDLSSHKGRLLLGDPVADAYEWLQAYALNLTDRCKDDCYGGDREVTLKELLEIADSHQGENQWGDYLTRGGTFESESVDPTFWVKYAAFYEIPSEEVNENSFFSCSC